MRNPPSSLYKRGSKMDGVNLPFIKGRMGRFLKT